MRHFYEKRIAIGNRFLVKSHLDRGPCFCWIRFLAARLVLNFKVSYFLLIINLIYRLIYFIYSGRSIAIEICTETIPRTNMEAIINLMPEHAEENTRYHNNSPLHTAIKHEKPDIFNQLLNAGGKAALHRYIF